MDQVSLSIQDGEFYPVLVLSEKDEIHVFAVHVCVLFSHWGKNFSTFGTTRRGRLILNMKIGLSLFVF